MLVRRLAHQTQREAVRGTSESNTRCCRTERVAGDFELVGWQSTEKQITTAALGVKADGLRQEAGTVRGGFIEGVAGIGIGADGLGRLPRTA